jgi:predicted ATPase/DNA-binding XRE family transcriptional regulator
MMADLEGGQGPKSFALVLRASRLDAGLTQAELAEAAGISLRSVSDLERGFSTRPRRDTVGMLANALGLKDQPRADFFAAARRWIGGPEGRRVGVDPPRFHGAIIGRENEISTALAALASPDARLLSLTGPGGVGKTRLAAEIVARLADEGIAFGGWLALDGMADSDLVNSAIEEALRRAARPEGDPVVIVLDNFEHVLAAAASLPDLLDRSEGVRVLVTSRIPLRLPEERLLPVPLLSVSGAGRAGAETPAASAADSPGIALFIERALVQQPALAFVAGADAEDINASNNLADAGAIATMLDGLPLAIELAAAQLAAFSLPALRAWVERAGIDALQKGGEGAGKATDDPSRRQRQTSMRDTIGWSYDLLAPEDRALFRHLSVFSGGFSLAAAANLLAAIHGVAPGDLTRRISRLAATNLLLPAFLSPGSAEPRFAMLQIIRAFGREQLERDPAEATAVRQAHLAWVRELASRWRPGMTRRQLNAWLDELELERDNLRAALAWTVDADRADDALALAADLGRLWDLRDHLKEGAYWLDLVTEAAESADPPAEPPPLIWYWIGTLAVPLGDLDRCREMSARLSAIAARTGDPAIAARGAILTSLWLTETGAHAAATRFAQEGLTATDGVDETRPSDLLAISSRVLNRLGVASHTEAGTDPAMLDVPAQAYAAALRLCEVAGDESGMLNALAGLGAIGLARGEIAEADAWFRRGIEPAAAHRHWWYTWLMLQGLAEVRWRKGRVEDAARLLGAADDLERSHGFRPYAFWIGICDGARSGALTCLGPERYAACAEEGSRASHAALNHPPTLLSLVAVTCRN